MLENYPGMPSKIRVHVTLGIDVYTSDVEHVLEGNEPLDEAWVALCDAAAELVYGSPADFVADADVEDASADG